MIRVIVLVAIIGIGSIAVQAQGPPPPPPAMGWSAAEQGPVGGSARAIGSAEIGVISLDPLNLGGVVVDAPYSAEAVTEITQTLADGNRIEQRTSATIARDGKGRVRREQQGIALGAFVASSDQPIVTIIDPTTGVHLTLNYEQKVAYRAKPSVQFFKTPDGQGAAGERVTVMSSHGAPIGAGGQIAAEATWTIAAPPIDQVMIDNRTFELAVPPPPPPPPPPAMTAAARLDDVVTEGLEPREIEGIQAQGTRTTMTIPAGAMGNVLPIQVVSERWYSPELQVVLMTKRTDPRFGETVYRLTNISRSEPAPELFQVPAGFKVEEMRPGVRAPLKPEEQ